MMNTEEVLQSAFVDYQPGKPETVGLVLPQERTEQEAAELESVIVSLFYHGYSVMLHDEFQGITLDGYPAHVFYRKEEDKGYRSDAHSVQQVMNAEWWSADKQKIEL